MDIEPNELLEARDLLKKWEGNPLGPQSLGYLERGLGLLGGDFIHEYQSRANKLRQAYEIKVIRLVQAAISSSDFKDLSDLEHWHKIMGTFVNAGFGSDLAFKDCHDKLETAFGLRLIRNFTLRDIEEVKRDLQKATIPK